MKIRLADIEVDYRTAGAGDPVIMVHGLAEDAGSWADVQARLRGFATYAYDLRGHGNTDLGQAEGTLAQLGEDLIRFLEEVTGPAACVGYSLGGTIVLWVAAERPDLVRRAAVIGTSTVVGRAAAEFFHERLALIESDSKVFAGALADDTAKQILSPDANLATVLDQRTMSTCSRKSGRLENPHCSAPASIHFNQDTVRSCGVESTFTRLISVPLVNSPSVNVPPVSISIVKPITFSK